MPSFQTYRYIRATYKRITMASFGLLASVLPTLNGCPVSGANDHGLSGVVAGSRSSLDVVVPQGGGSRLFVLDLVGFSTTQDNGGLQRMPRLGIRRGSRSLSSSFGGRTAFDAGQNLLVTPIGSTAGGSQPAIIGGSDTVLSRSLPTSTLSR